MAQKNKRKAKKSKKSSVKVAANASQAQKQAPTPKKTKRTSSRKERQLAKEKAKRNRQIRYIGITVLVFAVFGAVAIIRQQNAPSADPLADFRASQANSDVEALLSDAEIEESIGISLENVRGDLTAPVSIVEYGDFG